MLEQNKKSSEKGFSLIELAIGVVIIGVLLVGALQSYRVWREEQRITITAEHVNKVSFAIQAFIAVNGHFPCPASLTAPRTSAAYGTETDCANAGQAPVGPTLSAAGVGSGVSGRTVTADRDGDDIPEAAPFAPRVRIGGVPFRSLNIPERLQYDAYGSRIVYAVTEFLANPDVKIQKGVGGINVVDANGNSVLGVPDSANYLVVAPGENLLGGYNMQGMQVTACAGTSVDAGNCNIDSTFVVDQKVDVTGANYFDDVITYNTPIDFPRWMRSRTDPNDIHTLETDAVVGGDFVYAQRAALMAREDPPGSGNFPYARMVDPQAKLWVRGTVRVDGDLKTNYICNESNEHCFSSSVIAGAGIACAPGSELMTGASTEDDTATNSRVTSALCTNGFSGSCGAGRVLRGISSGSVDCPCVDCSVCGCSGSSTSSSSSGAITSSSSTGITATSSYGPSSSGVVIGP